MNQVVLSGQHKQSMAEGISLIQECPSNRMLVTEILSFLFLFMSRWHNYEFLLPILLLLLTVSEERQLSLLLILDELSGATFSIKQLPYILIVSVFTWGTGIGWGLRLRISEVKICVCCKQRGLSQHLDHQGVTCRRN